MCRVDNYIKKDLVLCSLKVSDKVDAFWQMSMKIEKSLGIDSSTTLKHIWKRESYGSTGTGAGIAIPHARITCAKEIVICIASLDKGIDYGSLDGEDVRLMFLLIVPEGKNLTYLKLLSQISMMCNDKAVRNRLLEADSKEEIINIIRSIY